MQQAPKAPPAFCRRRLSVCGSTHFVHGGKKAEYWARGANIDTPEQRKGRRYRMEIKVYQDTVTAGRSFVIQSRNSAWRRRSSSPTTCRRCSKIVKCFVACVVLQKQFSAGRLHRGRVSALRGAVPIRKRRPACAAPSTRLPFTKQVELSGENTGAAHAWVSGQTE